MSDESCAPLSDQARSMKQEYVIFHRNGRDPFQEAGRTYATTGYMAVRQWLADQNDECPLATCDVAACASWALYRCHYEPEPEFGEVVEFSDGKEWLPGGGK